MTLEKFRSMLGWCTVINVALLLLWSAVFLFAHDWMFQLHTRLGFKLTPEVFDAMHYGGLGIYKLAIWLLNLAPYIALRIVGR
ncbi:MAG: hypothetical protein QOE70_4718 [Chthoniobacter sp.]|jgi:hypothetical protein|nr:hypothetical protein [Chthoniobacter sp.]